jgi:hypothetical protein
MQVITQADNGHHDGPTSDLYQSVMLPSAEDLRVAKISSLLQYLQPLQLATVFFRSLQIPVPGLPKFPITVPAITPFKVPGFNVSLPG